MKKNALAKRKFGGLEVTRPLTKEDITDSSLPQLARAQLLVYPQATEAHDFLESIGGRPLGENVLVMPLPEDDHHAQIIIPETSRTDNTAGIVVAVGKGKRLENGQYLPMDVRPGNYVVFSKYSFKKIKAGNYDLFQIHEGDITFVVSGPKKDEGVNVV